MQLLKLDQTYRIIAELGTYEFDDLEVWTSYEQQEKLIISSIDIRRGYKKGEQIILEDDDNFLSIELTAFMFPTSEDLIYYYRMDDGELPESWPPTPAAIPARRSGLHSVDEIRVADR